MLLGMGTAEIVIGIPILIAAILGNCSPLTIAMAAWISFHGLVGLLVGAFFYILYNPSPRIKNISRLVFFTTIVIGILLGIAAALEGGIARQTGQRLYLREVDQHQTIPTTPRPFHWYYQYDFELFFGVFGALFEACLLAFGVWSIFADRAKERELLTLANSRKSSAASMTALRMNMAQAQLKHSHSGFFNKKTEEELEEEAAKKRAKEAAKAEAEANNEKAQKTAAKKSTDLKAPKAAVENPTNSAAAAEEGVRVAGGDVSKHAAIVMPQTGRGTPKN
ncbi:hypothetical protein BV898_17674 [Hypsibius exemplaris]|uniref:Uncharacterized protein n=1 Tax=Hypsibius exemplaris TaxID=2072580 RepID=A0A9X6RMD5_HYPEX|nr:hypothetical protein BV898_17674 [Hypsibius exemplaris]